MSFLNSNLGFFLTFLRKTSWSGSNRLASLFYVFPNAVWSQFINQFFQVICLHLSGSDFHHYLPDHYNY
jgi:hypothetical protein